MGYSDFYDIAESLMAVSYKRGFGHNSKLPLGGQEVGFTFYQG